ncbi:MAG: hypothetical protein Q9190_007247, partial [Brigantiaea leucoxantha]
MAAPFNRLASLSLRHTPRPPFRRKQFLSFSPLRCLHGPPDDPPPPSKEFSFSLDDMDSDERHQYNLLSQDEKHQYQDDARQLHEHMTSPAVESELNRQVSQAVYDLNKDLPAREKPPRIKEGLMAMGEVDPQNTGEDDDFDGDDISSTAHGELEQHREMREYARIAAWEMPMLS